MAAKFFTGLPLDGPDPECVHGFGEAALAARDGAALPRSPVDHSRARPVDARPVAFAAPAARRRPTAPPPAKLCDESPLVTGADLAQGH